MTFETHRQALRAGLPWLVFALLLLTSAVGLPASLSPWIADTRWEPWIDRCATALGAFGSGAMLFALLHFARARLFGRPSLQLVAAFGAWTGELALRLVAVASEPNAGDRLFVARLACATIAMIAMCGGLLTLLQRGQAVRELAPWRVARVLFALFACGLFSVFAAARWVAPEQDLWPWIASWPAGVSLAWIAFCAPWVALAHAVRRSVRWVARRQTFAEIWTR